MSIFIDPNEQKKFEQRKEEAVIGMIEKANEAVLEREICEALLPEWAEKYVHDSMANERGLVGAQLCTKDGRRMGNAFINSIKQLDKIGKVFEVLTEAGNRKWFTERELQEFYHPVKYIVKLDEALKRFNRVREE